MRPNWSKGVGQKHFSNKFLRSGIGVSSDCVRTTSLTVFSVNWISFLFWVMQWIYLNTWNSKGSIMVNSVLGLAYWGGLGVAKLVLSVSQMDFSCLSERRVWRIFFGVMSWDFHTCTFLYTPCCTFLPCLSFFYTLLWNFCMLSCTIRVWHVLFECHPPWKLDSFGIMNLCYSLGCRLEGNCRARCFFSDWFDALSWHFCTFVCDSFIIYYQI